MTPTLDELLNLDPETLAAEEARANRPSFRDEPIEWEGDWDGSVTTEPVTYDNGTTHPKLAFRFTKVKFTDVGNAVGAYVDGSDYTLFMDPPAEGKVTRFSVLGKTVKASGAALKTFAGRVHVTELAETYKNAQGYDRQSYHWRFVKAGGTANGTKPTVEVDTDAVLAFIAAGSYTDAQFAGAAMLHKDFDNSWNTAFADGSVVRGLVDSGKVTRDAEGILRVV